MTEANRYYAQLASCGPATEDARRKSVLFNDIASAPDQTWTPLTETIALTEHLWAQGWRRDVRPEDVNSPRSAETI